MTDFSEVLAGTEAGDATQEVEMFFPSAPDWTFRFRGSNPGRFGGAIVTIRVGPGRGVLSSGVSICTPTDAWNPKVGIEIAAARMNCPGSKRRPNPWRFVATPGTLRMEHRVVSDFAHECLRQTFIQHQFSRNTLHWFARQLQWIFENTPRSSLKIRRG